MPEPAAPPPDPVAAFQLLLAQQGSRGKTVRAVFDFLQTQGTDIARSATDALRARQDVEGLTRESWWKRALEFVGNLPPGTQRILVGAVVALTTVLGVNQFPGVKTPPEKAKLHEEDETLRTVVQQELKASEKRIIDALKTTK